MKKIAFLYLNKTYAVYHSLSIAFELATNSNFQVNILTTPNNLPLLKQLIESHKKGIYIPIKTLSAPRWMQIFQQTKFTSLIPEKVLFLKYKKLFSTYDAFVTTMFGDLSLKEIFGFKQAKYIWTTHGVINRAYSFNPRIKNFDLFFIVGKYEYNIRKKLNQLTPTNHAITGYIKNDVINKIDIPVFFKNKNPTVVYNPHWEKSLTSFKIYGKQIFDFFANRSDFNLIFAPHYILTQRNPTYRQLALQYKDYPNILVDLGSERCNDMSYTKYADVYIGDASSQAMEFIFYRSRPCIYLDAHELDNNEQERPLSWDLGTVVTEVNNFAQLLQIAEKEFIDHYQERQQIRKKELFYQGELPPSELAVRAIIKLLNESA